MLPVCVDAARVAVALLVRMAVAGGDPLPEPAVLAEREDFRALRSRDRGGRIRRAVVDDEDVDAGQPPAELAEDGRQARLLVPRRNEDDRVGHGDMVRGIPPPRLPAG